MYCTYLRMYVCTLATDAHLTSATMIVPTFRIALPVYIQRVYNYIYI